MAARLEATLPDDIDQIIYLKNPQGLYRGFKPGYISQNLTKMESYLVTCTKCEGIIRDASSCGGQTVCKLCTRNQSDSKRVLDVRNYVADLNIKCPLLRDCGWSGKLLEGGNHLKECGNFLITCPLKCGDVMKRCEMNNHIKINCLRREVKCEFCDLTFTSKKLRKHLAICPAYPIVCKCRRSVRRDGVEEHIDKDCELTEIECPYARYSCKIGKIPRKDLLAHKREFYIEHQDMIERENCLLAKQVKTLKLCNSQVMQKHELLEGKMKEDNDELMQKHELLKRKMKVENDKLVQEHKLLEGNMKTKHEQLLHEHDLLEGKYAQLNEENEQLVLKLITLEWVSSIIAYEINTCKKLTGTAIELHPKSETVVTTEFDNGQYRFIYGISSSADKRTISLRRLPTSTYSDKNILCVTECTLRIQGTPTVAVPYIFNTKLSARIEMDVHVPLIVLCKHFISRYQQPDGIVRMEVHFDYDYITYKGFFS